MRLIDADALFFAYRQKIENTVAEQSNPPTAFAYDAIPCDFIEKFPVADVVPVVHGIWRDDGDCFICSHCKKAFSFTFRGSNYCPNCGAKMDGGADNG